MDDARRDVTGTGRPTVGRTPRDVLAIAGSSDGVAGT